MRKTKDLTKLPLWKLRTEFISPEERSRIISEKCKSIVGAYRLTTEDVLKASEKYWELFNDPILCTDVTIGQLINAHFNFSVFTLAKYADLRPDVADLVDRLLKYAVSAQYLTKWMALKSGTTATLMPDGSLELHTSDTKDAKSMPPFQLTGTPVVAVFFARLIIGGEDRGNRAFMANINDGKQMALGVECRGFPQQGQHEPSSPGRRSSVKTSAGGLGLFITFNRVRLPVTALLSFPDTSQDSQRAFFDDITATIRGSLSFGAMSITRMRMAAYMVGTAVLRDTSTLPASNGISISPSIFAVLTGIAQALVFAHFGEEIRVLFNSLDGDPFRQHFMGILFKEGAARRALENITQLAVGQQRWAKGLLEANKNSLFCDNLREMLLADRANSIRFAMEVLLSRLDPPMTANPDSILARHELSIIQDTRISLSTNQHRDPASLAHSCQRLLEAIAHRMAYEAAVAANVDGRLIDLFKASVIKLDPGWYAERGGVTRVEQAEVEKAAVEALLPQLPGLLHRYELHLFRKAFLVFIIIRPLDSRPYKERRSSFMPAEIVRSVVQEWANTFVTRNYTAMTSLAVAGANYWISGMTEKIPFAGDLPYADRVQQIQTVFGGMDTLDVDVLGITVEGDVGILEFAPNGSGPGDRVYKNNVLIKMVVQDGKIQDVREYVDAFALLNYLGIQV
ncbi:hypothetical protein NLJ89_g6866 [Agrocybe chaxingu]|uniref:SnoaL-like domain-containing protein n=1 Tax=Agrocybe chaxingu TaxID=84603 RepID=A0A9W8JXY1_9AGAR|nr:hypothetical protein NLJ89_g6866 [Agrocybe chaxingu]